MSKTGKEEIKEYGWSDKLLKDIAGRTKFPKEVFKIDEIKPIISRFFHFYFFGEVSSDCTIPCTIYSAIALLNVPYSNGYSHVFAGKHFKALDNETPFFDAHVHTERKYFEKSNNIPQESFQYEIYKILFFWNMSSINEQATLMRLTAFLALKFCAVVSKNKSQMILYFSSHPNLRKTLCNLVGWEMNRHYSEPNSDAIYKFIDILTNDKNSRLSIRSLFAIVVKEWINIVRIDSKPNRIASLLMESLLEETAGNGIGLISLITSVIFNMNVTYSQVLDALKSEHEKFNQYEDSYKRLVEFQKKFVDIENPELSYPWGRLIKPTYLSQYSAPNNLFICGIFASINQIYEGPRVWNAQWSKKYVFNFKEAKEIGKKIHDRLLKFKNCEN
ncbi:uncharacterized protein LOC127285535 [Leptopilina boulardi]|uniref:uncharacterized protein LOC127285535 n=1 Tax=Leptopilina boulardi TaxID=63433 RepID=UPI0021F69143|nr:uncharacterized protein LOC127285535 [Leptopilina boulardi]